VQRSARPGSPVRLASSRRLRRPHRLRRPAALALLGWLAVAAATARPAAAHDFWMVPAELVVPADRQIMVSLYVGEGFVAESEKPFQRDRVLTFRHFYNAATAAGTAPVVDDVLKTGASLDGQTPLVSLPVRGAGGHLLAMERKPTTIELAAAKFDEYLRHEGLEPLVRERARLGESGQPGRERYSRYLKTLIQVGDVQDQSFGLVTGAALELVPSQNPVFLAPGDELTVQILFRGQPLPGARLEASWRDGDDVRVSQVVADGTGRATVKMDRRGMWLLRMVHMVRCEGCPDADWESFWTSYTFATLGYPGATVVAPPMMAPMLPRRSMIIVAAVGALVLIIGVAAIRRRAPDRA
jgi:uncharacterized GH25 family protein